ncbi:MAG: peptidase family protein, partial [Thermoleophilia bacterium]|nr:peptidase family protein [Thermoleophilia bacterium]
AMACYAEHGFADEWRDHHQGGLAGYEPREAVAAPGSTVTLAAGNACSWNPSVAGTKSEDTVIVTAAGVEIATDTGAWPRIALDDTPGGARPDILQLG